MKTLTMITRHGKNKDNILAYTLISSDYQTVTVSAKDLESGIKSKKFVVVNMDVENGKLVSTNGALDKYTLINVDTNSIEGTAKAVILNRVEVNGKLAGYTIFTQSGTLAEVNVADAVALCNKKLISNGKIRHTQERDIVSAINGNYPLREITMDKAPKGEIAVNLLFFGTALGTDAQYFGGIVECTSATEMSKINDILSKSNAKIISTVAKVAGHEVRESLGIKRVGANSLYGVFEISILEKLVSSKAKVASNMGAILVSAVKYDSNKEATEATVKLSKELKPVGTDLCDIEEIDNKAKSFAKTVATKFNGVIK